MAKIKFRTADGRVVSFTSKGSTGRNPGRTTKRKAKTKVRRAKTGKKVRRVARRVVRRTVCKVVRRVVRAKPARRAVSTKGWTKRTDCRGRVYYLRARRDGGHDMKWGANGRIVRLAPAFKKGGGRRKVTRKLKAKAACGVPVRKKKGDTFVRRGITFRVATRKTRKGGFKRIAVRVKRSRR